MNGSPPVPGRRFVPDGGKNEAALATGVKLTPVVRYREFPFGTIMIEHYAGSSPGSLAEPEKLLDYLRSGHVLGLTMGADLTDWLDRSHKANPLSAVSARRRRAVDKVTSGSGTRA